MNYIDRLKKATGLKSQKDLQEFLGVKNLSALINPPYKQIIEKSINCYHLDYIFHGTGEVAPSKDRVFSSNMINNAEMEEVLTDLVKYGNKALLESIKKKLEVVKISSRL
jgi:hypothetical protein